MAVVKLEIKLIVVCYLAYFMVAIVYYANLEVILAYLAIDDESIDVNEEVVNAEKVLNVG